MLGRHPCGQQSVQLGIASPFGAALAVDPVRAFGHRTDDCVEQLAIACEPPVLGQRPQRAAVGVPFARLTQEEPVDSLPARIRSEHLGRLRVEAVAVERGEQEGGVAEPEPVVRARPGVMSAPSWSTSRNRQLASTASCIRSSGSTRRRPPLDCAAHPRATCSGDGIDAGYDGARSTRRRVRPRRRVRFDATIGNATRNVAVCGSG